MSSRAGAGALPLDPDGAAAAGAAAATAGRNAVCWLPIIQPAISPRNIPATAKTSDSDFMMQETVHAGNRVRTPHQARSRGILRAGPESARQSNDASAAEG